MPGVKTEYLFPVFHHLNTVFVSRCTLLSFGAAVVKACIVLINNVVALAMSFFLGYEGKATVSLGKPYVSLEEELALERLKQAIKQTTELRDSIDENALEDLRESIEESRAIPSFKPPELKRAESALPKAQEAAIKAKVAADSAWVCCHKCGHEFCGGQFKLRGDRGRCGRNSEGKRGCCKCGAYHPQKKKKWKPR